MKTIALNQIEDFLNSDSFLLYGVSATKQKFGNTIFKELNSKAFKLFPIHPTLEKIENQNCYTNLSDLPEKPKAAIICTKPDKAETILKELKAFGINKVWLQQGSFKKESHMEFEKEFDNFIFGKCILMFANQNGIHKFHSKLLRFFGKYPN